MATADRVLARTERLGDCLIWLGARNPNGYGQINVAGKRVAVHRAVYVAHRGVIAEGMEIDHLCRVRNCVEISHLEAVTHAENVRRSIEAITHCPQGHAKNALNTEVFQGRKGMCRRCRPCHRMQNRAYRRRLAQRRSGNG